MLVARAAVGCRIMSDLASDTSSDTSQHGLQHRAKCLVWCGKWREGSELDASMGVVDRKQVNHLYQQATTICPNYYKAWHRWASSHYHLVLAAEKSGYLPTYLPICNRVP